MKLRKKYFELVKIVRACMVELITLIKMIKWSWQSFAKYPAFRSIQYSHQRHKYCKMNSKTGFISPKYSDPLKLFVLIMGRGWNIPMFGIQRIYLLFIEAIIGKSCPQQDNQQIYAAEKHAIRKT